MSPRPDTADAGMPQAAPGLSSAAISATETGRATQSQTDAVRVEVLCVVFQMRTADPDGPPELHVLLWRAGTEAPWALPGGDVGASETLSQSGRRLLADTLDLRTVAHLEQLSVFSDPDRVPDRRTIASTYLGLVPSDSTAQLPTTAAWHRVDSLTGHRTESDRGALAYDHAAIVAAARTRLAGKLSYTNIAFALAPAQFAMSELAEIYGAVLGYRVDTTNLLRILSRRGVVAATGLLGRTGRAGGRPPALYAFADNRLRVTDEFATLKPPM